MYFASYKSFLNHDLRLNQLCIQTTSSASMFRRSAQAVRPYLATKTSIISRAGNNITNFNLNKQQENKQEVVSITYEEIGLFPRSFSRVLDRFLKQVFSDVENLVIQEYRFYRYLFLTTLKCLLILFFIPFFVNFVAKTYIVRPLTEYFWNTKQTEIFLNASQQKHAFAELKEFEEKTYFESLIFPKSVFTYNAVASEIDSKPATSSTIANSFTQFDNLQQSVLTVKERKKQFAEGQKGNTVNLLKPSVISVPTANATLFASPVEQTRPINDFVRNNSNTYQSEQTRNLKVEENKPSNQGFLENKSSASYSVRSTQYQTLASTLPSQEQLRRDVFDKSARPYGVTALFIYETQEADKNLQQRYQEKTIELAQRYNDQSVEAISNIFADLISLLTLFYLLYALEIQINITKSFLLEVFFGLDDSKKSLLILLVTDLLVGYHSSNLWELFFEFLFHHYGLPESQTGVFLLVATLPVLLDVLFKYLIFRHLNRSSPATVATYHAMIE